MTSQNPWQHLKPLYVLPEDFAAIAHHKNYSNLRLDTLPDQAIGGLDKAEVIFLLLNPGFDDKDITVNLELPQFTEANRRNLVDPFGSPFYYFGGGLEQTGGYAWWSRILNPLIKAGVTEAMLRDKIMAIEYFPYHSKEWKDLPQVPSQQVAFRLVRDAITRGKTIVIMRGKDKWQGAVKELASYENIIVHPNARNVSISPKNIGEENFHTIRNRIIGE
jgi:hypothetical protein